VQLVPNPEALKSRQNELGSEFKGGVRDWWDPGKGGDIGLSGVARILEDAALRHERYDPGLLAARNRCYVGGMRS
jgi:hypothetical protein